VWKGRGYFDDIPDQVPPKIYSSGRAPSYKAIAVAILKNDLHLKGLGFSVDESDLCRELRQIKKDRDSLQLKLLQW